MAGTLILQNKNMARSLKKGPYVDPRILKKIDRLQGDKEKPIKTWSRACTISPEMVGYTFLVHNGKDFISVKAGESMVGHKLGEFSPTTKFYRHGGRMQRELEKGPKGARKPAPKKKK
jgi:small subunit ribosomal protein S19